MLNEQDIRWNLKAVDNAIAQQRQEGLDVPMDVIADLKRAARGEIHIADGIQTTYQKFARGQARSSVGQVRSSDCSGESPVDSGLRFANSHYKLK